jgi:protein SCO1/2
MVRLLHRSSKLALLALATATLWGAEETLPPQLEGVGITEKLGNPVDLNLQFTAENGYQVPLSSFFHKDKPVILNLVYYSCPMLCNLVLNGQTQALHDVAWTPGEEFEVVTISIDPSEMFNLAAKKKQQYLESYGRPTHGWHFLTDYKGNVKKLAEQVGFGYKYDDRQQQFAHAAAIMILTPQGKVSRYLYGIHFKPRDVRLALSEASESKLGVSERILMFCFHYDPVERSYVLFARNLMRAGGVLIVLILGIAFWMLWRGERVRALKEQLAQGQASENHLVTVK